MVLICGAGIFAGCKNLPPPATVNLLESGWIIRHADAIWKPNASAEVLAVELLFARRAAKGQMYLQVSKAGLPLVEVMLAHDTWSIRPADGRGAFGGRGNPPAQAGPGQLAHGLAGLPITKGWEGVREGDVLQLRRPATGEEWEVFLEP